MQLYDMLTKKSNNNNNKNNNNNEKKKKKIKKKKISTLNFVLQYQKPFSWISTFIFFNF